MFQAAFPPIFSSAKNVHSKPNRVERRFPAGIRMRHVSWLMMQLVETLKRQLEPYVARAFT
jgi:hypothetical protein